MSYADYKKTRVKRTEEEKFEYNLNFVKGLIRRKPEMCLESFEMFANKRNRKSLEYLGIHNVDDLQRYIDSQEA